MPEGCLHALPVQHGADHKFQRVLVVSIGPEIGENNSAITVYKKINRRGISVVQRSFYPAGIIAKW